MRDDVTVLRPVVGRVITLVVAAAMLGVAVLAVVQTGFGRSVDYLPTLGLIVYVVWMLFWAPCVEISPGNVTMVNPARTVRIEWPQIQRIDTKWALEIYTAAGRFTAWAAPAPGRHGVAAQSKSSLKHLPESSYYAQGSIRPGDTPSSDSGQAAIVVRRRWEELRDAGFLDAGVAEHPEPIITWNWVKLAALFAIVLLVAGLSLAH